MVRTRPAIEAAFWTVERVTLAGSTTPGGEQVDDLAGDGVEAEVAAGGADALDDDRAFEARVLGDLAERLFEGALHDQDAGLLVALVVVDVSSAFAARSRVTPPPGTMPSSTAARVARKGVLVAVLLLLELGLGGGADLDDGDAAGELGEALLELLLVVVAVGLLDLALDLLDAAQDVFLGARAAR